MDSVMVNDWLTICMAGCLDNIQDGLSVINTVGWMDGYHSVWPDIWLTFNMVG